MAARRRCSRLFAVFRKRGFAERDASWVHSLGRARGSREGTRSPLVRRLLRSIARSGDVGQSQVEMVVGSVAVLSARGDATSSKRKSWRSRGAEPRRSRGSRRSPSARRSSETCVRRVRAACRSSAGAWACSSTGRYVAPVRSMAHMITASRRASAQAASLRPLLAASSRAQTTIGSPLRDLIAECAA